MTTINTQAPTRRRCMKCGRKRNESEMVLFGTSWLGPHYICDPAKEPPVSGYGSWRPRCVTQPGSLWNTFQQYLANLVKIFPLQTAELLGAAKSAPAAGDLEKPATTAAGTDIKTRRGPKPAPIGEAVGKFLGKQIAAELAVKMARGKTKKAIAKKGRGSVDLSAAKKARASAVLPRGKKAKAKPSPISKGKGAAVKRSKKGKR